MPEFNEAVTENKIEIETFAPQAVLSDQDWEALKIASMAGVGDKELAAQYEISQETIRSRRFRDEIWKATCEKLRLITKDQTQRETEGRERTLVAQKAASSIAENIASIGTANRLLALQIASKGLKRADQANLEVENWQDFKILVDSVAKLTGLEGGNSVQVNVLTDGSASFDVEDFPVIDADES